jgi:hypothetical protein
MGDKSPKAKNKNSQQHSADKNKKHDAAVNKQTKAPADAKKGK